MSTASCPLCGSTESVKCFDENGYAVLRCNTCDLFYIDPYPSVADVRRSIAPLEGSKAHASAALRDRYAAEKAFYDEHFQAIFKQCAGARSLLEVGCGTGRLLELMRDAGLDCEGVEPDPARAEAARVRSGCTIHAVPVEELQTGRKFDVITLINVLSHIPALPEFFIAIRRLLAERGKLIIVAGEMRHDVERRDAAHWSLPIHLHFLGFSTIEYICEKFGFRILARDRTPYSSSLFSRARFASPGRSRLRNLLKALILRVPFALRLLRWSYDRTRGGRVLASLIVLSKAAPA